MGCSFSSFLCHHIKVLYDVFFKQMLFGDAPSHMARVVEDGQKLALKPIDRVPDGKGWCLLKNNQRVLILAVLSPQTLGSGLRDWNPLKYTHQDEFFYVHHELKQVLGLYPG